MTFVLCFFSCYLQTTKRFGKHHRRVEEEKLFTILKSKLFELVNITQRAVKRHEAINNVELKEITISNLRHLMGNT